MKWSLTNRPKGGLHLHLVVKSWNMMLMGKKFTPGIIEAFYAKSIILKKVPDQIWPMLYIMFSVCCRSEGV